MSSLNFYTSKKTKEVPITPLVQIVPRARQEEDNYGKLLHVVSSENIAANDSVLAGNGKTWNAYYTSPTLEERMEVLEQKLLKQEQILKENGQKLLEQEQILKENGQKYYEDVIVFSRNLIITVAAEILLFAIGEQPKGASKSDRMVNFLKTDSRKIKKFLTVTRSSYSAEKFAKDSDTVIDRRNNGVAHFISLQELEEKVSEAHSLFERHENLKVKFKHEWFIIENYEHIKNNFYCL